MILQARKKENFYKIMSQAVLPLQPSNPVRALVGLASQIALPHEVTPQRFPSFPALERTAVMGFTALSTLPLPASTPIKVMLSRQAAFPAWAEQVTTSAWLTSYATDTGNVGGLAADKMASSGPVSGWAANKAVNSPPGTSQLIIVGTNAVSYAPLGADDRLNASIPFTYVPAGSRMNFIVCGALTATQDVEFTVAYERWVAPGEATYYSAHSGTILLGNFGGKDVVTAAFPVSMWIRPTHISLNSAAALSSTTYSIQVAVASGSGAGVIAYTASALSAGIITLTPTAVQTLLPLVVPAEFSNSVLPWSTTRTTACAFLGTNVSQVLNKAGTVLAGRISPSVTDPFNVTSAYISTLHPAEKAFLPLETGVYTYCPPSTDLSTFLDYTSAQGTGAGPYQATTSLPMYHLGNDSLVNIMFITAGSVAESLACTVDWHIEFRTSSALFQIGLSTIPIEVLHTAQISLASVGYFFENVRHKKLLATVTSATRVYSNSVSAKNGPKRGQPNKGGSGSVNIPNRPGRNPAATSGQGSGMVRGPVRGTTAKSVRKNRKKLQKRRS